MLTEPWQITLFGRLQVERAGRVIYKFRTSKTAALLAYLTLHTTRPATREELIALFWPDDEAEKGRGSLRVVLASLRRILETDDVGGGNVLRAEGQQVELRAGTFVTDVARFETCLHEASEQTDLLARKSLLEEALTLYAGDLLPGFYDDWALQMRERLLQRSLDARRLLAETQAQTGDLEGAIQNALRVVSAEPQEEAHHLALMRLYLAAGQPEQARRQYKTLERVLREEENETPSPQALALLRNISAAEQASSQAPSLPPASLSPVATPPFAISAPVVSSIVSPTPSSPRLPAPLTPIVGRDAEIAQVVALLKPDSDPRFAFAAFGAAPVPATRLVTLIAPGGMGKTRLALAAAQELEAVYCEAVWWINLAGLEDAQRIPEAIRDALRLERSPSREPLAQVTAYLRERPAVLILDNFEPLLPAGSQWARTLLEQAPDLRLLVTSRRVLNLEGEYSVLVPPLPIDESTRLFVARAQAVRSDFTVTPRNAANVENLCAHLEGIPLALELAAARIGVRTPAEMLQERRLDFLVSRRVDIAARHQTLRAVIASTVATLPPALQSFFARLSVFHGGWTSEAATFVCREVERETTKDTENTEREEQSTTDQEELTAVRDRLETLREFALISTEEVGETMRGRMLDTLREYGAEQLPPEEAQDLAERHATFFLNLAEEAVTYFHGAEQKAWLDRLEADHNNLRAALDWLCAEGQVREAMRLAVAMAWFWRVRGYVGEGRQQLQRVLALSNAETVERARALRAAAVLANYQDDITVSTRLLSECLALARRLGHTHSIAWALYTFGHNSLSISAYADARRHLDESLALFEQTDDRYGLLSVLHKLGSLHLIQGAYSEALGYFTRVADMTSEIGDHYGEALARLNIGTALANLGDEGMAAQQFAHSAALFATLGDTATLAVVQIAQGACAYRKGDYAQAETLLETALTTHRQHKGRVQEAIALYHLGQLALRRNQYDRARDCFRDSLNLVRAADAKQRVAMLIGAFGRLALAEGNLERAARLLGASAALLAHLHAVLEQAEQPEYAQAVSATRAALGDERFALLWAEGETFDEAAAVSFALHGFTPPATTP